MEKACLRVCYAPSRDQASGAPSQPEPLVPTSARPAVSELDAPGDYVLSPALALEPVGVSAESVASHLWGEILPE